ncbi:unnamed protein product [Urochloa humidicola]
MVGSELRDRELERRPGEEMEQAEEGKEAVPGDAEAASCYCSNSVAVYCRRHRDNGGGEPAVHWVAFFNKPTAENKTETHWSESIVHDGSQCYLLGSRELTLLGREWTS